MINIAEQYKNRYFINSTSLFNEWGVIVEDGGYSELMKPPKRKKGYEYNWEEENGLEIYVLDAWVARTITLNFVFICENKNDYLTKMNNLYDLLRTKDTEENYPGYIYLSCTALLKEWKLLYMETTNVEQLTDITNDSTVIVRHTLNFLDNEVFGTTFEPIAYLTDNQGNLLTDENENILTEQIS